MIIDIERTFCGLPPGKKYQEDNERENPFIRGWNI